MHTQFVVFKWYSAAAELDMAATLIFQAATAGKKVDAAVGFVIIVPEVQQHSRDMHGIQQSIAVHISLQDVVEYFQVVEVADSLHVHVIAAGVKVAAPQV